MTEVNFGIPGKREPQKAHKAEEKAMPKTRALRIKEIKIIFEFDEELEQDS